VSRDKLPQVPVVQLLLDAKADAAAKLNGMSVLELAVTAGGLRVTCDV
jgi:hypothetical protein